MVREKLLFAAMSVTSIGGTVGIVTHDVEVTPRVAGVLQAFLADPLQPQFGFGLMEQLRISSGTLYPILAKLKKVGWLDVQTEEIDPSVEGRPARRYYLLTAQGEVAAVQALNRMSTLYAPPRSSRPRLAGGEA